MHRDPGNWRGDTGMDDSEKRQRSRRWTGIALSAGAVLLFAGIAIFTLPHILDDAAHRGQADRALVLPLLLSLALIIFGWLRHHRLAQEVASRTASEERAQHLAARDPLTGFLNRRSLAEEGGAMFDRAKRRRKAMALLMLDLDHFKTINDMHGHAVGDALIRAVAKVIEASMPPMALTARFGGDEFACAFKFDPQQPQSVDRIAEQLLSRLAQPVDADGVQLHASASIGIARSDFGVPSIDALMRSADIAMYAAKNGGRNRYAWFDQSMERDIQARTELENGLRRAIPAQQIVPYFEQQIDLQTGRLHGFEVLARWEHPQRGMIPPDTFIPIAEESGLISDMSVAIMRQAFAAARDWHPALSLSVNISPYQLKDPWLAQKIIRTLTETGFPASRLEVEITESSLFDNLALAQSIVGSLKNQGIRLALDDFGTGYSSLAHLRALPFDRIKIDKSFVTSINTNPESVAIVKTIVSLGDSLNLPITAEGIEDASIQERLRQLGCHKGQGYHYGRPISIANARRMLAERRLLVAQQQPAPQVPTSALPHEPMVTSQRLAG